ncbi:MAG: periplasmic protein TonB [Sphingomonadales bacterium]|nr:periplasmic protein TonB [Sphingomonadales bacterium]
MSSYRGTADRPDQAKAIAAVVAVHAALAFVILSGLNVRMVRQTVESLTTIAIDQPPPPPPIQPPKPAPTPQAMKKPEGAAAKQAQPTPVVAPQPKLPVPSPIPAAKVAGAGSSTLSGAAQAGSGTGAGGSGTGTGGGGTADYSRFTPARLVRNLTRSDYRALAAGRMPAGRAMVSLRIEPTGQPSNCRVLRSSGDPYVDSGLCPLIIERLRFLPALDDRGRPIAYQLNYVATWTL